MRHLLTAVCLGAFALAPAENLGTFLYVGDSITAGAPFERNIRYQVQYLMRDGGYEFDFVGSQTGGSYGQILDPWHECHPGWSALELAFGRVSEPHEGNITTWMGEYRPDWVYVMACTPDTYPWITYEQVRDRLTHIGAEIYRARPDAKVMWGNLPMQSNNNPEIIRHKRNVDRVIDEMQALYTGQGKTFAKLDLLKLWTRSRTLPTRCIRTSLATRRWRS